LLGSVPEFCFHAALPELQIPHPRISKGGKMNPHTREFLVFAFSRAALIVMIGIGVTIAALNCLRILRNLVFSGVE